MRHFWSVLALAAALSFSSFAFADDEPAKEGKPEGPKKEDAAKPSKLAPKQSESEGSVTIGGKSFDYKAVAGTPLTKP